MPTGGEVFIAGVFVKKPASGKARRHGFEIFLLEDDSDTVEVRIDTQLAAELGDIEEGRLILVEGAAKINYIGESSLTPRALIIGMTLYKKEHHRFACVAPIPPMLAP